MRKVLPIAAVLIVANAFFALVYGQAVTLKGTVRDAGSKLQVAAVSVVVKGSNAGTYTDDNGKFSITVAKALPLVLEFSAVNYVTQTLSVSSATDNISVELVGSVSLGQEVVVSATRTPARILESPVSIERVNSVAIKTAAAPTFYDMVANLKGVDMVTSSLTFRTPTTRGFAGSGNTRFNQIMDGMDNQAPGLNFSVGSIIGLTELDVDNFELLQGASSALYGPGGMNGTLLINSKNPFKYQGLSAQVKTGVMHVDNKWRNASPYQNWAFRYADVVCEKFAFKIGAEFIHAKDWIANDYRNYKRSGTGGEIIAGTRSTDPGYDGINVYGDETNLDIKNFVLDTFAARIPFMADYISTLPDTMVVSRTGYNEIDIVNPNTKTFKFSGALHYKLTPKIEAVLAGHWGTGNTVYTGAQRYSLRDFKIGQYKLELLSKNWFFRAFTTQENSGNSHDLTVTTRLFNEVWKPSTTWYPQYATTYINARMAGATNEAAHATARNVADQGRPAAGSQQFKDIYNQIRTKPIPTGGLFLDRSDMYWAEAQLNISDMAKWDFADVLIGGNYRQFVLNSQGTLFMKEAELIKINELGAYAQIAKNLISDKVRLTASGRFDKNENFEGRFTPRVTLMVKPAKDHNIRVSYQTAYRFPSTQQQWIDLNVGSGRLLGENQRLWEKYNLIKNAPYLRTDLTKRVNYLKTKPESVTSIELGYKSLIAAKLLIDAYVYGGVYQDFISRTDVIQFAGGVPALTGAQGYSVVVNAPGKVKTYGWGASADYLLPAGFRIGINASGDQLKDLPEGFRAYLNVPKIRTNLSLSKDGIGRKKLIGANLAWRWQDKTFYESDFVSGNLDAFHNLDASVNFKAPKIKSLIKIGASNLLNSYYRSALGNPSVGGLYYVSFGYNVL